MSNARATIDRQLVGAVQSRRRGRDDFADPIRSELERRDVRQLWHAATPPAGEIGDQDVGAEVKLGLDQDDPAARRARTAEVEGAKCAAEPRGGARVARRGAGLGDQGTAHDLGDAMAGDFEELLVDRASARWFAHRNRCAMALVRGPSFARSFDTRPALLQMRYTRLSPEDFPL